MSQPLVSSPYFLPCLLGAGTLLASVEAGWCLRKAYRTHHPRQLASDLACALVRLPVELGVGAAFVASYRSLQAGMQLPVFDLHSPWAWLVSFLAFELVFYWTHRLSHCTPILWAVHAVHHQSNDFNLVAATRLGMLAPVLNYPFFLLLALVGVPIEGFLVALYVSGGWQFMLHTRLFSGPRSLCCVFNTPRSHRTHHSAELHLGNRNFASILLCLDRLFGTYSGEEVTANFGLDPPLAPCGPVRANLEPWRPVWRATLASLSLRARACPQANAAPVPTASADVGWSERAT